MSRLRVAIQKSGRLSEHSLEVLKNCGLKFARSKDKLFWYGQDFPVDLLLVRDDDIPRLLLDGTRYRGSSPLLGPVAAQPVARRVCSNRGGRSI